MSLKEEEYLYKNLSLEEKQLVADFCYKIREPIPADCTKIIERMKKLGIW